MFILMSFIKEILKEGLSNLTKLELIEASKARGMPAYKLKEDILKQQLSDWINLSVVENIPISILLFSSALYTNQRSNLLSHKLPEAVQEIPDELVINGFLSQII